MLIALGYVARRRIAGGLQPSLAAAATGQLAAAGSPARVKAGAGAPRPVKAGTPVKVGADAPVRRVTGKAGAPPGRGGTGNRSHAAGGNGHPGRERAEAAIRDGHGPGPGTGRMGVTLRKLRWSVAAETVIAVTVLAVTAMLVNTPTARETYLPPAVASAAFNTGGPGGRGNISLTVTPAGIGPNRFRVSITGASGKPYHPQQLQAGLWMPAENLGPLAVQLTPKGPGRYLGGPAVVSTAGQWQLRVTIRSDAFDEVTVILPFSVH
jgi:nitrogen fixation protein FixH